MSGFPDSLRETIALEGPITVERYMALCLAHYYGTRDPLGVEGDFTTAPEISQIFGELIGLWLVEVWHAMGRPSGVRLVELGPGRGTLMADMLRAAKVMPEFLAAISVHLVETSPALRTRQEAALRGHGLSVSWHDRFADVPAGPVLVVANEFFDALPIRQFVATERGWCERLVGLDGGNLIFGLDPEPEPRLEHPAAIGELREWHAVSVDLVRRISQRLCRDRGTALIIDYGYWGPAFGDTLQAVERHGFVDALASPGAADLTAHVDFAQLAHAAQAKGARIHGMETQARFLHALGIATRAARLKQHATPEQATTIGQAVDRLTAPGPRNMGDLFKVIALTDDGQPSVPGLHTALEPPRK